MNIYVDKESKYRQAGSDELIYRCIGSAFGANFIGNDCILRYENQKPRLESGRIDFSVSHTNNIWTCVVSKGSVGLDIEERRNLDFVRLATRFFTQQEKEYVERGGKIAFYKIWTAKEAFIKFTGQGLKEGLSTFSVLDEQGNIAHRIVKGDVSCTLVYPYISKDVECALCFSERETEPESRFQGKNLTLNSKKTSIKIVYVGEEKERRVRKQKALNYLAIKSRAAGELKKYLKMLGADDEEANNVAEEMKALGYLDDLAYCRQYITYGANKNLGIRRIEQELREKAPDSEALREAIEEYRGREKEYPYLGDTRSDRERALETGRSMVEGKHTDAKLLGKVGRRLAYLGYNGDDIYHVIDILKKERY